MRVARNLSDLAEHCGRVRSVHGRIALVPTMGALHVGHRALVDAAKATGAGVVASIFVNPLQFGANEDFRSYPRDEGGDLRQLEEAGCHLVWLPDLATMYPADGATTIEVAGPAERWEGEHRPGHFRGVATVVAKLLGQVRPDLAFFGEKDWQQLQVIRRMVADLHLPHAIMPVTTVRETDGLACSSRNQLLTPEQRRIASLLYREMADAVHALGSGIAALEPLARATNRLSQAGFAPEYFALVDGATLAPLEHIRPGSRLIVAARLGNVRLIDNVPAMVQETGWSALLSSRGHSQATDMNIAGRVGFQAQGPRPPGPEPMPAPPPPAGPPKPEPIPTPPRPVSD